MVLGRMVVRVHVCTEMNNHKHTGFIIGFRTNNAYNVYYEGKPSKSLDVPKPFDFDFTTSRRQNRAEDRGQPHQFRPRDCAGDVRFHPQR